MRRSILGRLTMILCFVVLSGAQAEEGVKRPAKPEVAVHSSQYVLAPFGSIVVYRPDEDPKAVVLFLSGTEGWSRAVEDVAMSLAKRGFLVAGISTPALLGGMEKSGKCVDPNYPLIALARDLQHHAGVKGYMKPFVVGYGSGAAMAYGALAQWPNAGYQGVVSMAFRPTLSGRKPWCRTPGFVARGTARPMKGWNFAPSGQIKIPWIIVQGRDDRYYTAGQALQFVSRVPGARLMQLPGTSPAEGGSAQWAGALISAVTTMLPPPHPVSPPGRIPIPDMPITLVPATRSGPKDVMAVIYSGDGGWVGIDRDVAAQLASAGIPVVGIDSLSYFWSARTPKGAGADLSQIINGFSERWNRPRVILIGYSFGADALPYMIANIDGAAREKIASLSLLGLGSTADFQFHLMSWLNISSDNALPTIPAITRLRGLRINCVRGVTESHSACTSIPKNMAQQFLVPGDHHFNRNAPLLARIILGQQKPGAVGQ